MEPQHVAEDRRRDVLRLKRPGCVLVHCHGDKTFNWFDPRDVEPISRSYEARSGQKHKSPGVKVSTRHAVMCLLQHEQHCRRCCGQLALSANCAQCRQQWNEMVNVDHL
jgi:hypothetical protein